MWIQTEVRLRVDGVELAGAAGGRWITAGKVQNRLPGCAESVAAANRNSPANKVKPQSESVVEGDSARGGIHILQTQASRAVSKQIVPALRGLVLKGHTEIGVLVALERIVRDGEELNRIGLPQRGGDVTAGHAQLTGRIQRQPCVGHVGAVVESIVG